MNFTAQDVLEIMENGPLPAPDELPEGVAQLLYQAAHELLRVGLSEGVPIQKTVLALFSSGFLLGLGVAGATGGEVLGDAEEPAAD